MDYWAATMQDDVYLIVQRGWMDAAKPRLIVETKEQKSKEQPDFTVGKQKFKSDLIPAALLIARYFAAEQAAIESAGSRTRRAGAAARRNRRKNTAARAACWKRSWTRRARSRRRPWRPA